MKPFSHSPTLTDQQKTFNYGLSRARVVVEIAFGRLKACWRRLSKQIDMHIDNTPHVITACCVLQMSVKCMGIPLMKSGCKILVVLRIAVRLMSWMITQATMAYQFGIY